MTFKQLKRSVENEAVDPPIDESRADPSLSINQPTAKPRCEIQPSEIEMGISFDNSLAGPGSPEGRIENRQSPNLREEQTLEKHEELTEKQQAKDLKIKARVRMAKMLLRGVNFSCSLIVLTMTSTALHIFFATQHLPAENNLPAWATGTQTWPQCVVLATSCVSIGLCVMVFYLYWRRGHRGAERMALSHSIFAVGVFLFGVVMWGIAAGILQASKNHGGNENIWGWSCVDNKRRELFSDKIDYALVCKLESWTLICCVIEVVVETITIGIYSVILYRYYSKQQLRKAMDARDQARSDLYSAELRSHSAPMFELLSRSYSSYMNSPPFPPAAYTAHPDFGGCRDPGTHFMEDQITSQPSPIEVYATTARDPQAVIAVQPTYHVNNTIEHVPRTWSRQIYDAVPIPSAYTDPASLVTPHQASRPLAWRGRR